MRSSPDGIESKDVPRPATLRSAKVEACHDSLKLSPSEKVTFSRPFLRSYAQVMAGAARSQRTAGVPAMARGAARLSQSNDVPRPRACPTLRRACRGTSLIRNRRPP